MDIYEKTSNHTIFLLSILFIFPASTVGIKAQRISSAQAKDFAAVKKAFEKLVDAFDKRDGQAIVSNFAEDIVLVSPRHPDADYKTLSEGFPEIYAIPPKTPYTPRTIIEEIQVSGDLAFVRAIWIRESIPDKKILYKEKDIELWQRQKNGEWKLARGYSYGFEEDFPLTPVTALPKSERASGKKTRSNLAEDIKAVKTQLDKLVLAYNNRDLETTMSLYAPDSLLSHDGVADTAREQTGQAYAKRFANPPRFPITISYQTEEIQTSGDLAFARLIWLVERNSDRKVLSRNKDLEIWQRQKDGSWKLVRGIGFYLKTDPAVPAKTETQSNSWRR